MRLTGIRVALCAALVVSLTGIAASAHAQQATTTATVRGVVTAAQGPLASASVTAINSETGVHRSAHTDEKGRYQLPFLAPGTYTLRAQRIGYRPVERPGVVVSISEVAREDFNLEASPVQL